MTYPRLMIMAAVVVVVAALYFAQAVLVPVAFAILLSFVLSPLVALLERCRLGRVMSVLMVTLLAFAAIGFVGWLVVGQADDLLARLPEYRENLHSKLAMIRENVQAPLKRAGSVVHELEHGLLGKEQEAGAAPAAPAATTTAPPDTLVQWVPFGLRSLLSLVGTAGVVVLLVILMLLQRGDLRDRLIALAGEGGVVVTTQALDEGGRRLSRYLFALTLLNGLYGAAVGAGLALIGVPNALLWGILSAVLRFIPYVGAWAAAAFPILYSFAISQDLSTTLFAVGLIVVLELITANIVEPLVYPNHVGVSSTALVVSAVFWTWLWGIPGLALATPLTMCIALMGNHIPQLRFLAVILGDKPVLSTPVRLYQRLLVGDAEDAWNLIAAEFKSGKTLVESYDEVVIPALCLAQQDRHDGVIDRATYVKITERTRDLVEEAADHRGPEEPAATPADPLRVLCLSAGEEADAVACTMVCNVLRLAGANATEMPHGALVSEAVVQVESAGADTVCISQIPPLSFSRLRYMRKRLAERLPSLPIIIGTWTVTLDPAKTVARVHGNGSTGAIHVVGTLAELVTQVQRVASLPRGSAPTETTRTEVPAKR